MKLKFNNEKTIEELQHASPAKPGKHFQSFLIDCILLILVSYIIFLGANVIAMNSNTYKKADAIVKEEINFYNDYVEKSRAVEFEIIDGQKVRKDLIKEEKTGISKIILENANRAIYYSLQHYGDSSDQFGIKISDEDLKIIEMSVSDKGHAYDDNISYFYTNFLLNSDAEYSVEFTSLKEAQEYVHTIYKEAFGENATNFFVFDFEQSPVPILKSRIAHYLYYFIYVDLDSNEQSEFLETSQDCFYLFDTAYSSMLSRAERIMIQSEPYYSTNYMNYFNNNAIIARCVNIALVLSIVLGYCLVIVLPKLIFKHGRTYGRLLFKLGEISIHNEPITWRVVLVKGIFESIGYLSIIFFIYMLNPFGGSYNAMMTPFIGNLSLLVILVIIFIGVLINGIFILFTRDKVGIGGLLTKSVLVDRKRLDELVFED